MFVLRADIEKILATSGDCSVEDFAARTSKGRWHVERYQKCYVTVLAHYGIDNNQNNARSVVRFLKSGDAQGEIGPKKRKRDDVSMVESSDDEGEEQDHDVSMTSVMSLDEPQEVLFLKRKLAEQTKELKGMVKIYSESFLY